MAFRPVSNESGVFLIDDSVLDASQSMRYLSAIDETAPLNLTTTTRGPFRNAFQESCKFYSPEKSIVPEIVVMPPSEDRKRPRKFSKTPSRTEKIFTPILSRSSRFSSGNSSSWRVNSKGAIAKRPKDKSPRRQFTEEDDEEEDEEEEQAKEADKKDHNITVIQVEKIGTVVIGRTSQLSKTKSPILSPRNRNVGHRSSSETPLSAKKIQAILTEMNSAPTTRPSGIPKRSEMINKVKKKIEGSLIPQLVPKGSNLRMTNMRNFSFRPVAEISPFKPKVEDVSSPIAIRGVRLNRRFELMMKFRNNNPIRE